MSRLVTGAVLLALAAAPAAAGARERHGGDFLRVELGAAPVATGLAGLLSADPGTRAWWNPALLEGQEESSRLSFQHQEAFSGALSLDYLSWSGAWAGLPWGVFLLRQAVPDIPISEVLEGGASLEEGGRPVVRREDAADWVLGLATARPLARGLAGGLSFKLIHRDLAVRTAQGLGLDAGLRWRPAGAPVAGGAEGPRLELGLSLRDLTGSVLFWDDGRRDWIPPEWAVGAAVEQPLPRWRSRLRAELDLRGELEGAVPDRAGRWRRAWLHGGVEWRLLERLALRAGWAEGDPAAGAGLRLGPWCADYAWRPHAELGTSHLVTVSARLP